MEHGQRLAENEWWEISLEKHGQYLVYNADDDRDLEPIDLWFEDSLWRRYPVRNAAKNLDRLYGRNR